MNREFIWIGIIILLVLGSSFFVSIMATENNSLEVVYDTCAMEKKVLDENVDVLQNKIIVLQEENNYLSKQTKVVKQSEKDLQVVYDRLWDDALNCFWANYCAYYPVECEEHFSDGLTAQQNHLYYSDECDMMVRDWDLYAEKSKD